MKRITILVFGICTTVLLSSCATRYPVQPAAVPTYQAAAPTAPTTSIATPRAANSNWPLIFNSGPTTYTVFEPQSTAWDGHQLTATSAVGVQSPGKPQPIYGIFTLSAITLVDKTAREVALADVKITGADFPSARGLAPDCLTALRQEFPRRTIDLPLDHLENSLTAAQPPSRAERLNNTPPRILFSTRPAVLVYVNGLPAWRPVLGTTLERVINTRALLLRDQSGQCYLHLFDGYLQAPSLDGPWTIAGSAPAGAGAAEKIALDAGQSDLLRGEPNATTHALPSLSTGLTPAIFVATKPSELITFTGQPDFAPIPGTGLLYAVNTSANVFKLLTDQQLYVLISGRWYRAPALNGPWTFVPGNQLPHDFADIPDTNPKENVKAAVPGTSQAEEALIANRIPQSTAVARTNQMQNPQVDGPAQLAPIEGTPLQYVVNSATPIIEVAPQSWYSCQNGIWYSAASSSGPWSVAISVPAVIYTIPTTSPLHYVTYVQMYGSTPDSVYEGYTPGYLGTEVADDGTVVYGTGYDYSPWIGSVWYGPPVTWGCGFDECWTPWWGWGFDCGFGWGWGFGGFGWCGCFPPLPWWGGFRHEHFNHRLGPIDRDGAVLANTRVNIYRHGGRFVGPVPRAVPVRNYASLSSRLGGINRHFSGSPSGAWHGAYAYGTTVSSRGFAHSAGGFFHAGGGFHGGGHGGGGGHR
jgi:hypothetical protein